MIVEWWQWLLIALGSVSALAILAYVVVTIVMVIGVAKVMTDWPG